VCPDRLPRRSLKRPFDPKHRVFGVVFDAGMKSIGECVVLLAPGWAQTAPVASPLDVAPGPGLYKLATRPNATGFTNQSGENTMGSVVVAELAVKRSKCRCRRSRPRDGVSRRHKGRKAVRAIFRRAILDRTFWPSISRSHSAMWWNSIKRGALRRQAKRCRKPLTGIAVEVARAGDGIRRRTAEQSGLNWSRLASSMGSPFRPPPRPRCVSLTARSGLPRNPPNAIGGSDSGRSARARGRAHDGEFA